jgi:hypothetical protein
MAGIEIARAMVIFITKNSAICGNTVAHAFGFSLFFVSKC